MKKLKGIESRMPSPELSGMCLYGSQPVGVGQAIAPWAAYWLLSTLCQPRGPGWEPVLGCLAAEYVGKGLQGDPSSWETWTCRPSESQEAGISESQTSQAPAGLASPGAQSEPPRLGPAAWRPPLQWGAGEPRHLPCSCASPHACEGHRAKEVLVESPPGLNLYNSFY